MILIQNIERFAENKLDIDSKKALYIYLNKVFELFREGSRILEIRSKGGEAEFAKRKFNRLERLEKARRKIDKKIKDVNTREYKQDDLEISNSLKKVNDAEIKDFEVRFSKTKLDEELIRLREENDKLAKIAEKNMMLEIALKNDSIIMSNKLEEVLNENSKLQEKIRHTTLHLNTAPDRTDVETMTVLELDAVIKEFRDADCQTTEDSWEGKYKELKTRYKDTIDKANERIRKKEIVFDVNRKEFLIIHAINEQVNRFGADAIRKEIIEPLVVAINTIADSNPNSNFGDTMKMISILFSKFFMKFNK